MIDTTMRKNKTFLSNIKRVFAPLAIQAGQETGFNIWTEDGATDITGNISLPDLVELHSGDKRDHKEFWLRYEELKKATNA